MSTGNESRSGEPVPARKPPHAPCMLVPMKGRNTMPVIVTVCGANDQMDREEYGQFILDDGATEIRRVKSAVVEAGRSSLDFVWDFEMLAPPKMTTVVDKVQEPERWLRALPFNFSGIRFWCELKK